MRIKKMYVQVVARLARSPQMVKSIFFRKIFFTPLMRLTTSGLLRSKNFPKKPWFLAFEPNSVVSLDCNFCLILAHCDPSHYVWFSWFWSHFFPIMCIQVVARLPQMLKSMFFEIFSNGAAPKGPAEWRKNFKQGWF